MQMKCSFLFFAVVVVVDVVVDNQDDVVVDIDVDVVDMAGGTAPNNVIALESCERGERGKGESERGKEKRDWERDDDVGGIERWYEA